MSCTAILRASHPAQLPETAVALVAETDILTSFNEYHAATLSLVYEQLLLQLAKWQ